MGLEVLVDTVVKLDLVIGNGNRFGLPSHWARSALLIEHRLAQRAIHLTIIVRISPESVLCSGRCSARMIMVDLCCVQVRW